MPGSLSAHQHASAAFQSCFGLQPDHGQDLRLRRSGLQPAAFRRSVGVGWHDLDRGHYRCPAACALRCRPGLRSGQKIPNSLRRPKQSEFGHVLSDSLRRHLGVEQHDTTVDAAFPYSKPRPALLARHGHRHYSQQDPALRWDEQLPVLSSPRAGFAAWRLPGSDAQRGLGVGRQ